MGNIQKIAISVVGLALIVAAVILLSPKAKVVPAPKLASVKDVALPFKAELLTLVAQEKALTKVALPEKTWGVKHPFDTSSFIPKAAPVVVSEIIPFPDPKVVLHGIIWTGPKPSAVINDKVVGIEGKVGSWVVKQILPKGVILNNGTKDALLKLRD